jgi:atlastin
MSNYLEEVLAERNQKDLKEVRDQIKLCFETVSCWLLPHPGFAVIKKDFDGDMEKIEPEFRRLASDYIRRVFGKRMTVKKIQGRPVTAMELFNFAKVYCALFKEAKIFPEAKTLLAATALATNMNALQSAMEVYKREMDRLCGTGKPYVTEKKLKKHNAICAQGARDKFNEIATMGPVKNIRQYQAKLNAQLDERFQDYLEANRLRDPFSFVAPYVIPIMVALVCYAIRYVLETVCPRRSEKCLDVSDFFASLQWTIMSFLIFVIGSRLYGVSQRVKFLFGKTSEQEEEED